MKSTIDWYAEQAERTYAHQEESLERAKNIKTTTGTMTIDESHRLLHGILGMAGEAGEIIASSNGEEELKEIGDWAWYSALAARAIGVELAEIVEAGEIADPEKCFHPTIGSSRMIEDLKKWLFYGAPINKQKIKDCMVSSWRWIVETTETEATLQLVLEQNVEKLRKRFPTKFTAADAIARVDV